MRWIRFIIILWLSISFGANSQEIPDTDVSVDFTDLKTTPDSSDLDAGAVVLSDKASAIMVFENGNRVKFTRQVRIKIFSSEGFAQANVQIPFGRSDKITSLHAITYNLENGKLAKTELDKNHIYIEKVDPVHNVTRFTFLNVHEGSVIEYTYTLLQQNISMFHGMRFQRDIPVKQVEYEASIPDFFTYSVFYNHSELIRFQQTIRQGFYSGKSVTIHHYFWSGRNIPAFVPEPMMPEGGLYLARVDFTLTSIQDRGLSSGMVSVTYPQLTRELLDHDPIGMDLGDTLLLGNKIRSLVHPRMASVRHMQDIYQYVLKHMRWNGYEQLWPNRPLVQAFREGVGTNAEINLILVNLLRSAGIQADPVLVSTRDQGPVKTQIAVMGSLNYLVCIATLGGKDYLLDATDQYRPAGMLPFKCLNDRGWVLSNTRGRWIPLLNGEKYGISEYYDLNMHEDGKIEGQGYVTFTGYYAVNLRKLIANQGLAGFRQEFLSQHGDNTVSNLQFENLDSIALPLKLRFQVNLDHTLYKTDSLMFFKPLISLFLDFKNPWLQEKREYPIDEGCPRTEELKYTLSLPPGVQPEQLPEMVRLKLEDNDAMFMFGSQYAAKQLSVAYELALYKPVIMPEEYPNLRSFYIQAYSNCRKMIILQQE